MQLRRYSSRIPTNSDDYLDYLDAEVADYVSIISKVARNHGDTERCISYPMMADNVPPHSIAQLSHKSDGSRKDEPSLT